eukprot:COSAG04_NODE_838_length_9963_cov_6.375912_2_plen_96_part_00
MLPRDCSSNSDTEFFVQHAFCKAGGAAAGPPNAARTNTAGTPFAGKAAQPDGCSGQHDEVAAARKHGGRSAEAATFCSKKYASRAYSIGLRGLVV